MGSGGGVYNSGTLTLSNDTVSGSNANAQYGHGGGIYNVGTMTIYETAVDNNSAARYGGGVFNTSSGTLSVVNSTIAKNTIGYGSGAGIDNQGSLSLTNSTITGNSGGYSGGIAGGGKVTISNTIVAHNTFHYSGGSPDIAGSVTAYNSLIGNTTGTTITDSSNTTNILNTTAGLAASLANNGGPTQTFALLTGSPAIGTGGAVTTVTTGATITNTATTNLQVGDGAAIASTSGQYYITIDGVEMVVTNVAGNTLTVENVTAASVTVSANDGVYLATDQRGGPAVSPPDIGAYSIGAPSGPPTVPTYIVTSTDGTIGDGSATDVTLPWAVSQGPDIIEFAPSLSGDTITLSGTLSITTNVDIVGLGANELAVSGGGAVQVFTVASSVTGDISGLTIEGGLLTTGGQYPGLGVTGLGSGVYNSGTLTLASDAISGNNINDQYGYGGGIYNAGTMTIYDSTVDNNSSSRYGGGVFNNSTGTLSVVNSTISGNGTGFVGAGIDNQGSLNLTNSTITGNAGGYSGGIGGGGEVTISNSIVANNTYHYGGGSPDIAGSVTAFNSLIGNTTGTTITDSSNTTNILNTTAGLAATLGNNGGPTQTFALLTGSPAIGTGGAVTTVTTGATITNTATTNLQVGDGAAIASTSGQYYITIDGVEMLVTKVAGNTLTVENVTAASVTVSANDGVYLATDQRGIAAASPPDIGAYSIPTTGPTVYIVTSADGNLADGSATDVTLPWAVSQGPDIIEFAPSLAGETIVLSGTLDITTNVDIVGLGANLLAVSGNGTARDFLVSSTATASITGLTIEGGGPPPSTVGFDDADYGSGGGISNSGTLTLSSDVVSNNDYDTQFGKGGGIYNAGVMTIYDSTVANNTVTGRYGGGIYNDSDGKLTICDSTITGNSAWQSGGGISNSGSLNLTNSTISGNTSGGWFGWYGAVGGLAAGGTVTMTNTIVAGNTAHGAPRY